MYKLLVIIVYIIVCVYVDFMGFDNEVGVVENNNDNNINLEYKLFILWYGVGILCVIRLGDFIYVVIFNDFFNCVNLFVGFVNVNLEVIDFVLSVCCKV